MFEVNLIQAVITTFQHRYNNDVQTKILSYWNSLILNLREISRKKWEFFEFFCILKALADDETPRALLEQRISLAEENLQVFDM